MTTLREAAQQALEALEESEQHYGSDSALRDAIQILRAALEQPDRTGSTSCERICEAQAYRIEIRRLNAELSSWEHNHE